MKTKGVLLLTAVMVLLAAGLAWADPELYPPGHPKLNGSTVTIPQGAGGQVVDVEIYDKAREKVLIKHLGPVYSFTLEDGQGFNFRWKDCNGDEWYDLFDPAEESGGLIGYIGKMDPRKGAAWVKKGDPKINWNFIYGRK